jgi:hypothetical protein
MTETDKIAEALNRVADGLFAVAHSNMVLAEATAEGREADDEEQGHTSLSDR